MNPPPNRLTSFKVPGALNLVRKSPSRSAHGETTDDVRISPKRETAMRSWQRNPLSDNWNCCPTGLAAMGEGITHDRHDRSPRYR